MKQMMILAFFMAGALVSATPKDTRTVECSQSKPVPVTVERGETTLFVLPEGELIYQVYGGNGNWQIGPSQQTSEPSRFLPVVPKESNITTVLHVISNTQKSCEFEIREGGIAAQYDTRLDIAGPGDSSRKNGKDAVTPFALIKWVPASEVAPYREKAETARKDADERVTKAKEDAERDIATFRANYPASLNFRWEWDRKACDRYGVETIFSDDRFVYIKGSFPEPPAMYELRDNKPSIIQFDFKNGLYTIAKRIDSGYLTLGHKKSARCDFNRTEGGQ